MKILLYILLSVSLQAQIVSIKGTYYPIFQIGKTGFVFTVDANYMYLSDMTDSSRHGVVIPLKYFYKDSLERGSVPYFDTSGTGYGFGLLKGSDKKGKYLRFDRTTGYLTADSAIFGDTIIYADTSFFTTDSGKVKTTGDILWGTYTGNGQWTLDTLILTKRLLYSKIGGITADKIMVSSTNGMLDTYDFDPDRLAYINTAYNSNEILIYNGTQIVSSGSTIPTYTNANLAGVAPTGGTDGSVVRDLDGANNIWMRIAGQWRQIK